MENFNFPLELIDNNGNIFPCDGSPAADKGCLPLPIPLAVPFLPLSLPAHFAPSGKNVCEDREERLTPAKRQRGQRGREGRWKKRDDDQSEKGLETNEPNGEISAR